MTIKIFRLDFTIINETASINIYFIMIYGYLNLKDNILYLFKDKCCVVIIFQTL